MKYRPKEWENIRDKAIAVALSKGCGIPPAIIPNVELEIDKAVAEEVADAMLEALKKEGLYGKEDSEFPYDHTIPITYNEEPAFTKTGWLVFIPEGDDDE